MRIYIAILKSLVAQYKTNRCLDLKGETITNATNSYKTRTNRKLPSSRPIHYPVRF